MSKKHVTKEQVENARAVNLAEYFISNGYEYDDNNDGNIHIHHFLGLHVHKETGEWFQFGSSTGGKNPIDCLIRVMGIDFVTAVSIQEGSYMQKLINEERQRHEAQKPI